MANYQLIPYVRNINKGLLQQNVQYRAIKKC